MNVVFEWGWGHSLFRISSEAPVEVFVPVLLISILFGLSMDYEVFLVSRIREEWVERCDNNAAVTLGQAATGRVITAAASIMILIFASFALGDSVIIKAVRHRPGRRHSHRRLHRAYCPCPFADAHARRANWWLPSWLDRALPHLNVEGAGAPDLALPRAEDEAVLVPQRAEQLARLAMVKG